MLSPFKQAIVFVLGVVAVFIAAMVTVMAVVDAKHANAVVVKPVTRTRRERRGWRA